MANDSNHQVTEEQVLAALSRIQDPDLHRDIVSLGFVRNVRVCGGNVAFDIELTTPACPVKAQMERQARELVGALPGVDMVNVKMTSRVREVQHANAIPGVKTTIAVASGKGGVGKSTVAVNLALGLAHSGSVVGLMDADVYGPSIPIMLGSREKPDVGADRRILPVEKYGIKMMSIGFLAEEGMPVIWRGPMVGKLLEQFLTDVNWGELDYLVIDLPPGTGDAQLTLCQQAPLSGAVVVTTPQDVALEDVTRAVAMFERVNVPVLGVVENMSYFICPDCGHREEIFAHGGGQKAAQRYDVPFLGEVPINTAIRIGSDTGAPIVVADPDAPTSVIFRDIATTVAARLASLAVEDEAQDPRLRIA